MLSYPIGHEPNTPLLRMIFHPNVNQMPYIFLFILKGRRGSVDDFTFLQVTLVARTG